MAPEALAKFEQFLKANTVDGKFTVSAQAIMDHYADQARDMLPRWQAQQAAVDASNKAACEARFSAPQLKQAESAVGFFASVDPSFRDWAKGQLNHPTFVNLMRYIGENISEDSFETGGSQKGSPPVSKKTRAQLMGYDKTARN